ncbi:unnamed protein product [Paramecium pentaurelia]|uniref:PSI domain-containing protein n=1 Tax=Paramecium pentaurelia TaxID=43138 RepID=A0A8S1URB4_9CILI|nr:unnamed protein product [Paramecium pentaurelia]
MKSYILFAILIGFGATQIVVKTQTICGCTQLTNQNDCATLPGCIWLEGTNQCQQNNCSLLQQSDCLKASFYCQWNPNLNPPSCSVFISCVNLTANGNQQCIQQNIRCLGFNTTSNQCLYYSEITSNCIDFPQDICSYNFGKDGPCYWINDQCQVINQCSYAQQKDQCQQLNLFNQDSPQGIVCQWNETQNKCTVITNCGQFTSQDTCKYYFSSLNSIILNVCVWSQNTCVPITNLNNLTSINCLSNTGLFFRWYGLQSNLNSGFCGPCKQISLAPKAQCTCSDYVLQSDCNSQNSLCQWNIQTKICTLNTCSQITTQNICITVANCYWSFNTNTCQTLSSCDDLIFKVSSVGCAAQSLSCAGYEGGNCINTSTISSTCSSQQQQINCSQFISSQGLCVWNNQNYSCSLLQYCNQITDATICGNWLNQCMWDAKISQCQQLTCSTITNEQSCTYVLSQFQSTQYQLCRWNNSLGPQGACQNAYSALLQTSQTCLNNTGNTFRWSTNNESAGMCVSCGTIQLSLQTTSSCQCSQLQSKENCQNTGFCTYNNLTNICSSSPCTQYENQITCASLSTCYWNSTSGCQAFTNCSSLTATNQLECINMNASCKGISYGNCQSFPTQTCATMYTTSGNCYNNIGTDGVCFLSINEQTTTQCIGFSQCTQATNETLCLRNQLSCSWNNLNNMCSQINCSSFKNQLNCKFYLPNPLSSEVIPCVWSNNICGQASDILKQLTQNTCASSTHNTYSWITLSTTSGYCIRCQQLVTLPKQCICSFLSLYDCSQALECYWNNGSCLQLQCQNIIQQTICASQIGCYWNNNQCNLFHGQCYTLSGKNQTECMQQNVYCVGSNGINCIENLNNCEANTQDSSCLTSLGRDGACYWNKSTNKCMAVNSCYQLPESACKIRSKSCYWDATQCQTLTCSTLYAQFNQCTFVMKLSSQNYVQVCQLQNNECTQITNVLSLSQDQCYLNTNKTARWIPQSSNYGGICYSCSANMIPTYNFPTCQCYQYMTQSDCNNAINQSCIWINNICTQQPCSQISSNQVCAQTIGCGWNIITSVCENFTSCNSISGVGLSIQLCLTYSTQCGGYDGANCTSSPTITCGSMSPSTCSGTYGSDGICIWNPYITDSCIAVTTCSQIIIQQICSYYSDYCYYANNQCQQLTCANFTTPASCKFVMSLLNIGEIQLCQWSTNTQNPSCINLVTSSELNSVNCSANTGFTYRWVPTINQNSSTLSKNGYCTKCLMNIINIPGQCACNQLIYQYDCLSNPQCSWSTAITTPSCYNKPCNQIIQQGICSSNPRCSWSATQNICQPFSSCSDLYGVNSGECSSYSIYCAAISKTFLQFQQKYICAPTPNQCSVTPSQGTVGGITTASDCQNTYVNFGICQYNPNNQQCTKITMCSDISTQQQCQQFNHACFWQPPMKTTATASCVAASCNNFTNQQQCTYILNSLSATNVTLCQWQTIGVCIESTNTKNLSSTNCYSNTLMMSRWSSTQPNSGFCATCSSYSQSQTYKSPCFCNELSQQECLLASPQCSYNSITSACVVQNCQSIISQYSCAANPNCIYIGSCQNYIKSPTSTTYGCANITTASSPFDCLTASVNCPKFVPDTISGSLGKCYVAEECSKLLNGAVCNNYYNQAVAGYCVWYDNQCQTINNCKQIIDIEVCSLQSKRCQWSVLLNSCITQSCNSYTSQSDCNYVYTSYTLGDIALCYWDSFYNECRSANLSLAKTFNTTNSTQCYVNTGHVYHLNGNDCIRCFQDILSIFLITMFLILI